MDKITKVAVCSRSFSKNSFLRAKLLERFENVKFNDQNLSLQGDSLIEFLKGTDRAIVALEVIDRNVLSNLPQLKVIGKYGVGLDKLDFGALKDFGIQMGWTPGVNALAVAELTLNLALTIVRKTVISNQIAKNHKWSQVVGRELSSLTVGILGCGHVGTRLLNLLSGFNCKIFICDKLDKSNLCNEFGAEQVSFDELISRVDLLSLHIPKNKETLNIINADVIDKMKDNSYVVNTARGGLVDEIALLKALNGKKLAGAALDVLANEPPDTFDLINHPNCMITSHIGGSSGEAIVNMGLAAIEGLNDYHHADKYAESQ